MTKKTIFNTLITVLVITGALGVYSIFLQNNAPTETVFTKPKQTLKPSAPKTTANNDLVSQKKFPQPIVSTQSRYEKIRTDIKNHLEKSQYTFAIELINSVYQQLSSTELDGLENLFITRAYQLWESEKTSPAIALLTLYSDAFNSLNTWSLLSNFYLENENWGSAIPILIKALSLEFQPEKIKVLTNSLLVAASAQKTLLETNNDEIGINLLYKNLHENQPNITRFQLELALSYVRLNDKNNAKPLLEGLKYDSEYAAIVEATLASLETKNIADIENPSTQPNSRNEIVVPLQRSGNSFYTNTVINNRPITLLLDTGASITSLSKTAIQSLNLKPTGRSIRLSTANGLTQAQLYLADQIRLGGLVFKNLVVAEIELGRNSRINGLLGTDLLNQLNSRYTYIIDNEKNALIFRAKN